MPKSKEDGLNQKSGSVSSNVHVSRLKSGALVRSNSSASLRESQSLSNLKRSASVKKVPSSTEVTDEMKTVSPEGEYMFHDGLLALYQETMELNKASHVLQGKDEIMSQLVYLVNKDIEVKEALVESTKRFVRLKNLVAVKENCDRLIPDYEDITGKLEAMKVSTKLSELFTTLDLMLSQVQAVNIETINPDDMNSYAEMCRDLEEDLKYLKQLRENQTEPLVEQANAAFETLAEKFERFELLKAEIERLDQLLRIRYIEDSCVEGG